MIETDSRLYFPGPSWAPLWDNKNEIFYPQDSRTGQKTINEKKLEELQKLLSEKKYGILTEYKNKINDITNEFENCRSRKGISQKIQLDCRKIYHQTLDSLKIKNDKDMKDVQEAFEEEMSFECAICLEKMD